jgi:hypothetical protein
MNAQLVSRIKYFRGPAVVQFAKNDSYRGLRFSDAAKMSKRLNGFSRWL